MKWGYRKVRQGDQTFLEHRIIAEKKIGRPLLRTEDVHHIDGNRKNNHIDNLEVCTRSKHVREHKRRKVYWTSQMREAARLHGIAGRKKQLQNMQRREICFAEFAETIRKA